MNVSRNERTTGRSTHACNTRFQSSGAATTVRRVFSGQRGLQQESRVLLKACQRRHDRRRQKGSGSQGQETTPNFGAAGNKKYVFCSEQAKRGMDGSCLPRRAPSITHAAYHKPRQSSVAFRSLGGRTSCWRRSIVFFGLCSTGRPAPESLCVGYPLCCVFWRPVVLTAVFVVVSQVRGFEPPSSWCRGW